MEIHNNPKNWYKEWKWNYPERKWQFVWWTYNPSDGKWYKHDPNNTIHLRPRESTPQSKKNWDARLEREKAKAIKEREIANMDMTRKPMEGKWLKRAGQKTWRVISIHANNDYANKKEVTAESC